MEPAGDDDACLVSCMQAKVCRSMRFDTLPYHFAWAAHEAAHHRGETKAEVLPPPAVPRRALHYEHFWARTGGDSCGGQLVQRRASFTYTQVLPTAPNHSRFVPAAALTPFSSVGVRQSEMGTSRNEWNFTRVLSLQDISTVLVTL